MAGGSQKIPSFADDDAGDSADSVDSGERVTHRCCACGVQSPPVSTGYTLISARFGWRLARYVANGQIKLEWRCPACWVSFKGQRPPPSSRRGPDPA